MFALGNFLARSHEGKKLFYHVLFTFCESMFQSGECKFARRTGTMLYQPRSKGLLATDIGVEMGGGESSSG